MCIRDRAERARSIRHSVAIREDQGRGFGERSQQGLDKGGHLVGVHERHSLFQQSVEGAKFDSKIGQEFAVVAEPTQEAAELLDVGRRKHLRERAYFLVVRGHPSLRNCVPQEVSLGGANPSLAWRELEVVLCLLYTSPSPRDATLSRMPSSA